MTNPDNYKTYIEDILHKQKDTIFKGETVVRKAIGSYGIKGVFLLLQLNSDDCYLYECETDDEGSRFRIKSYDIYRHKLGKIFGEKLDKRKLDKYSLAYFKQDGKYIYDEYYNKLSLELAEHNKAIQQALCELPDRWKCASLFIDGDYCEIPSVVYALQRNTTEIISMKLDHPLSQDNTNTLKCWFPETVKEQIRTNNQITFLDCLKESQAVFVPLDDSTLDSVFFNEIKWRNIVPNFDKDCEIAGINCKYIMLKIKVDGFQNVFCRATDAHGNNKCVLVYNALNVRINVKSDSEETLSSGKKEKKQTQFTDINNKELLDKNTLSFEKKKEIRQVNKNALRYTNTPSGKNDKQIYELIKKIEVIPGDTGHSYKTLFGDYLNGATSVVLSEPYIVYSYQWNNLKEFISLLIEIGHVRTFTLKTKKPELVKKIPKNMERWKFISDFNNMLNGIKNEISGSNVNFTWELSETHKRFLDIDDYHIDLDYGLDLYIKPEKGTVLSSIQILRKCKENHIKVYKRIELKS